MIIKFEICGSYTAVQHRNSLEHAQKQMPSYLTANHSTSLPSSSLHVTCPRVYKTQAIRVTTTTSLFPCIQALAPPQGGSIDANRTLVVGPARGCNRCSHLRIRVRLHHTGAGSVLAEWLSSRGHGRPIQLIDHGRRHPRRDGSLPAAQAAAQRVRGPLRAEIGDVHVRAPRALETPHERVIEQAVPLVGGPVVHGLQLLGAPDPPGALSRGRLDRQRDAGRGRGPGARGDPARRSRGPTGHAWLRREPWTRGRRACSWERLSMGMLLLVLLLVRVLVLLVRWRCVMLASPRCSRWWWVCVALRGLLVLRGTTRRWPCPPRCGWLGSV